jgi:hypothetical protein
MEKEKGKEVAKGKRKDGKKGNKGFSLKTGQVLRPK